MQLYIDQMFQTDFVEALRSAGHDAIRAAEAGMATADDSEILRFAMEHHRTLVTLDAHFGDWAVLPLQIHPGVIRLKVHPTTTENAMKLLLPFLDSHSQDDFLNHLIIVSEKRQRWIRTGN